MTGPRKGPGAGTRGYIALETLHSIGGEARSNTWMEASLRKWPTAGRVTWDRLVQNLMDARLVFQRDGAFAITDDGLAWLGVAVDAPAREKPVIVGPRYVAPMRPLSTRNIPAIRVMREGAFDYRDIPSLQGSARIEFKTSLKVAGGDVAG
ncbi:hypothetical protein HHL21_14450 [Massilia sp. RP-1-19]|uniref:Uncharacterized protein n=1 Tax=Massilia polaris TaxID=2728846 RepID=A0A848HM04_9BURK|nr:hypothetical protein [Massilia polaris]NML62254.1 hypothetical protein [Massilia polaris]